MGGTGAGVTRWPSTARWTAAGTTRDTHCPRSNQVTSATGSSVVLALPVPGCAHASDVHLRAAVPRRNLSRCFDARGE